MYAYYSLLMKNKKSQLNIDFSKISFLKILLKK
jgi:hypothetical protein